MQLSHYNFIKKTKDEDKYLLFNSRTGCLSLLDEEHYKAFKSFPDKDIADEDFKKQLRRCGYVVDKLEDEHDAIRYKMYRARFKDSLLSLVIAPTINCNFACTYCYEKTCKETEMMTPEVYDKIIEYIEEKVDDLTKLDITWYGGEPLMAVKIISVMNKRIKEICSKYNIELTESMITNGYLLTEENIQFLNENDINSIQITLDGSKEVHDTRRVLKSGKGTFDRILENLKLCSKLYTGHIDLRVNVDKQNIVKVDTLMEQLREEGLLEVLNVYLGKVTDYNEAGSNANCLSCNAFAGENLKFIEKYSNLKRYMKKSYPYPIGNACPADYNNSLIIAPNGDLYKCHMEIGRKDSCIGNIAKRMDISVDKVKETLFFDPIKDPVCSDCKYLPFCMGGCARARKNGTRECDTKKYYLDQYLNAAIGDM
ncbi:MAG: SPASM domain-containing protein [Lachnospiraceae bacterium]|nr:SPASM domain-containing protein [Lachnospiraceae bacterium]